MVIKVAVYCYYVDMNNPRGLNTYNTPQPVGTNSPNLNEYLELVQVFGAVIIVLSIAVFIIWIWSMIAMINLNSRFKVFLEEYRHREERQGSELQDLTSVRQKVIVEPLQEDPEGHTDTSWVNNKPLLLRLGILAVLIATLLVVVSFL